MLPGIHFTQAVERLVSSPVRDRVIGTISTNAIQLCPQTPGHLTERACEDLRRDHPEVSFRLHANARVEPRHRLLDASSFNDDTASYFHALADRSLRLGACAYTLHAGYRSNCGLNAMIDNIHRIQDIFGPTCIVGVEGLYPNAQRPHLMDSWRDYETVFLRGVPMALDLSHLHIVATAERSRASGLLDAMVASRNTIEIHVSGNDGVRDSHQRLTERPWWIDVLPTASAPTTVFCESNYLRPGPAQ